MGSDGVTGPSADELRAFEAATRDLVGLALRSVERSELSLPQFRLLLVLYELGTVSSTQCARALGRLLGHPAGRPVAQVGSAAARCRSAQSQRGDLALTPAGRRAVRQVTDRRRRELTKALGQLDPQRRRECAATLDRLHELLDPGARPTARIACCSERGAPRAADLGKPLTKCLALCNT
ncbi:hypothetical protein MFAL_00010 [Mycolicibacterium fallax]|nr:hypothetical protein MFAL_00010 [Mycolicibacterium fallax]